MWHIVATIKCTCLNSMKKRREKKKRLKPLKWRILPPLPPQNVNKNNSDANKTNYMLHFFHNWTTKSENWKIICCYILKSLQRQSKIEWKRERGSCELMGCFTIHWFCQQILAKYKGVDAAHVHQSFHGSNNKSFFDAFESLLSFYFQS